MAFSANTIKQSFLKVNKPKWYRIWYVYMSTTPTNFIYVSLKTPPLYTYVCKQRVISDRAVIQQTDPSPAPITMTNSHWFDDVAHIGICLGISNRQYTVCINSLLPGPVLPMKGQWCTCLPPLAFRALGPREARQDKTVLQCPVVVRTSDGFDYRFARINPEEAGASDRDVLCQHI